MLFTRKRTPTIMDGLVIRWQLAEPYTGQINASRNGVWIGGTFPVSSDPAFIEEAKVILDEAHRTHLQLRAEDHRLYTTAFYEDSKERDRG